ncbi:unnamed protein product [Ranitomeya imitator]|uniref:Tetraspanin n=1 Tax=Ranitomeya imitator TaxID=111125 RepID=A0ABN9LRG0_9NEOB|nr:unnamed protein product [Ranitomeya imitator]
MIGKRKHGESFEPLMTKDERVVKYSDSLYSKREIPRLRLVEAARPRPIRDGHSIDPSPGWKKLSCCSGPDGKDGKSERFHQKERLYVLIGAGALMMIIGFFGCCGAARESQCLLGAFFVCLLVIFAAEVTAGVIAFLGKQEAVKEAKIMYTNAYNNYVNNKLENTTLQDFHDFAKCCGIEDPKSAENVRNLCLEGYKEHKDCLPEIEKVLHHHFQIVGILAVATAGINVSILYMIERLQNANT